MYYVFLVGVTEISLFFTVTIYYRTNSTKFGLRVSDVSCGLSIRNHVESKQRMLSPSASLFVARASSLRPRCAPKVLWSGSVLFDDDDDRAERPSSPRPGSVVINTSGQIEACIGQHVSSHQAKHYADLHNYEFVNLGEDTCLSPGLIDVHTHISEMGGRNWEGYYTATRAAAAGGLTTIMGMPLNSLPPTTTLDAVDMERTAANSYSLACDVGLWGGVLDDTSIETLTELVSSPFVFGIKAFLAPLPPNAGYQAVTPQQLKIAADICGPAHKPILVHSELMTHQESLQAADEAFERHGNNDASYMAHVESRPPEWERAAVQVVADLCDRCDMHVVHLSDAEGCLPIIQAAKANNRHEKASQHRLTVETCPHYLLLTAKDIPDGDTRFKCFPPIRSANNQRLLKEALRSGLIDMIASDHSPCDASMRKRAELDMRRAWGGLSGLQYQLPATMQAMEAVVTNDPQSMMATWWSRNPSLLVPGLAKSKGCIQNGKQADLVAWDSSFVGPPTSYSSEHHRWKGDCVYTDMSLRGRVMGTWLAGMQVYDGETDSFPHENDRVGSVLMCERR